jgi:hypothetical protein
MTSSPSPAPAVPPLGLLLDVDGPIASPVTRTIAIDSITRDLVTLANLGIPVVFNTGRSDAFLRDVVVKPMLAAGLSPTARVFGICEKGAVWFGVTMSLFTGIEVDESVLLPQEIIDELHALLDARYADTTFWDGTKRAMVSVEQRVEVESSVYHEAQARFDDEAFDLLAAHGVGVVLGERRSGTTIGYRIDPTIISTDIEAVSLGKDLGARRAIELLKESGELPVLWRTVGDSRTDYAMADYLHENGFEVAHVDVRPADGIPEKPYPVITEGDLIHDEAGAAFLAHWVRTLA